LAGATAGSVADDESEAQLIDDFGAYQVALAKIRATHN
jgi:hypothetical protein